MFSGMSNKITEHIRNFAKLLQTGKYKRPTQVVTALRCAAGVGTAFSTLGLIRKDREGFMHPNWSGECPVELVEIEYRRSRKAAGKGIGRKLHVKTAPIAPELRQDFGEKMYTKKEVIDRFKAFYIREYYKMDDRAYTLTGFLIEALDDTI